MVAEAWDIESYLLGRAFPGINWRGMANTATICATLCAESWDAPELLMQRLYGSDDFFPDDPQNSYRPFQLTYHPRWLLPL